MSLPQESVLRLKKTKEKMPQIHYRILKPKVQNLEAKHTNLIGVFRIQERAQLELGRQLN